MKTFLLFAILLNASLASAYTYWGPKVTVGNGYARSFVEMSKQKIKKIGIAISPTGLTGLPMHEMQEFVLALPADVKVPPYKHMTLDWNPHGHEPDNVYTKPHFDFHFYFISNALRQSITCMNQDAQICIKEPDKDYVPSQYAPTPAGVPKMGWHWVDLLAPEFNGGIFTRTFIYGYYDGSLIFIEPMVTLEYLKAKTNSVNNIRRPVKFPYQGGTYPSQYRTTYDVKNKLHKIYLTNF